MPALVEVALALWVAGFATDAPGVAIPAGPSAGSGGASGGLGAPLSAAELRGQVASEAVEIDLAKVSVELECACFARPQRLRVDLRGEFVFTSLTPGSYLLRVRHEQLIIEREVELRAGEQLALSLDFDAARTATPAASPPAPIVTPRPAGAVLGHPIDEGAALRRYGLGFTVAGAVLGIGGLIAAYHNPCGKDGARGGNCETDVRNTVALTLGVTALGSITGGVLAMAIGQSLRRRARLEAGGYGLALRLEPGFGGLALRGRF